MFSFLIMFTISRDDLIFSPVSETNHVFWYSAFHLIKYVIAS